MTIGIGVLASEGEANKPNQLILLADTKGSFGDTYSMNRLHKLFMAPDKRLYSVGAGQMDKASELFEMIKGVSGVIEGGTQRYGSIIESVSGGADLYKRVRFKLDVLPLFARMPQSLPDMFTDTDLGPALLEEWRKYDFGCQMLIGAFNDLGQAFLLYIEGDARVSNLTFPGFAAIGSGLNNAMFWLSYRNHNLGLSVRRSAYHAFEAKVMAESSAHVNDRLDMVIASRDKWFFISDSKAASEGAPITLKEMPGFRFMVLGRRMRLFDGQNICGRGC
jgi:hypothetical protein